MEKSVTEDLRQIANSNIAPLVYGVLEVKASQWKKIYEAEELGIDLTSIVDALQESSTASLEYLLGDSIDVNEEHISELILNLGKEGITNGV